MRNSNHSRSQAGYMTGTAAALALAAALAPVDPASAYTETVLYNFCSQTNCTDGDYLHGGLLIDSSGNLYGTTQLGGAHYNVGPGGVIFELVKNGSSYNYQVLYSFCALQNCADGTEPESELIADVNGMLYGTTVLGGSNSQGTIFRLARNRRGIWKLKTLYNFCSAPECTDGGEPNGLTYQGRDSGVLYDGRSTLYGTTQVGGLTSGGNASDYGVAFELTGRRHTYHTIYQFCSQANCSDGFGPDSSLVMDAAGKLYGSTAEGGNLTYEGSGGGVAFKLFANGTDFSETVLYSFCSLGGCGDGRIPNAVLLNGGNIEGTTYGGGDCDTGSLFSLDTNNNYHLLDSFCSYSGTYPDGDVLYVSGVGLVGVTAGGGEYGSGVAWSYESGYSVLYNFCFRVNCIDGAGPTGGLVADSSTGRLFGVAGGGGANQAGVVFELSP